MYAQAKQINSKFNNFRKVKKCVFNLSFIIKIKPSVLQNNLSMIQKNSEFKSVRNSEVNEEEETENYIKASQNNELWAKYSVKTVNILVVLILIIFISSLLFIAFYLNQQFLKFQAKIPKYKQQGFLGKKFTQQQELQKFLQSFYKSWKNNVINQQNLKKLAKIKQLSETQVQFFQKDPRRYEPYLLSMNNHKLKYYNDTLQKEISQLMQSQYERMSSIYDFSLPQLPFCIVITSVNNSKDSRYEHNLRSVLNQNYTNYKVVIIDDASGDENAFLIQQLVDEIGPPQQIFIVRNQKNMAKLANFYKAAYEYCSQEDIAFTVDGDDQLLGINVFKVFNDQYQRYNLDFAYSHAIRSEADTRLFPGYAKPYTQEQKANLNYRRQRGAKVFNLASFKVSIYRKIKIEDFKDQNGEWFRCASDETMWPPLLQLSCGRQLFIDEYLYLNYKGLGNNNMDIHPECNFKVKQTVIKRPKYPCASKI